MHAHFLDPYRDGASPIHRLDPRVKLTLAVAFIVTAALLPPGAWPAYVLLFAVAFSVVLVSGLGVGYVYKRALLAAPFVVAARAAAVYRAGSPRSPRFSIGPWTLTLTQPGLVRFISVALKSWLSVQMAIVLAATTSFPDLLAAMRGLQAPAAARRRDRPDVALPVRASGRGDAASCGPGRRAAATRPSAVGRIGGSLGLARQGDRRHGRQPDAPFV